MGWFDNLLRPEKLELVEREVLRAVGAALHESDRRKFEAQVQAINKVQRHSEGKEVNLYSMRGGRPSFDPALRFEGTPEEVRIAVVNGHYEDSQRMPFQAEIWLANGRVFSIVFRETAKERAVPVVIDHVELSYDPHNALAPDTTPPDRAAVEVLFRPLLSAGNVEILDGPGARTTRDTYLRGFDVQFPPEAHLLFDAALGVRIGDCVVHGALGLRVIVVEGQQFVVLAERPDGTVLALRSGDRSGRLFLLGPDLPTPRDVGTSLLGGIRSLMSSQSNIG